VNSQISIRRWNLRDPILRHFDTVPACVRWTDGQSDRLTHKLTVASYADALMRLNWANVELTFMNAANVLVMGNDRIYTVSIQVTEKGHSTVTADF